MPRSLFGTGRGLRHGADPVLTWHRSRSTFGLPFILVGGVIVAHAAFWIAGISLAEAQASGWTFQATAPRQLDAAVERA